MRHLTTSDNEVKQFIFKDTSIEVVDEQARAELNSLSEVAKSGDYNDLNNLPQFATVATTGNYDDLIDKPSLAVVATTGDYDDLNNKPSLATVATTGDYDDLIDKPSLAPVATTGDYDDLIDKPSLATVATTGDYGDLNNKPSLATVATTGDYGDLNNKPSLATVATTGDYDDLANKPTIPVVNNATLTIQKNGTNVQTFTANASSNVTANITMDKSDVGLGNVGNFKAVSTVANQGLTEDEKGNARSNIGAGSSSFSGDYNDLSNKPALKAVATSGSYNDLTNKPTIPTVNNAILTIQKNGTNVQTFTANQSTNATANITMSKSDVGLGNVGNFKAVSTVANQGLTDTEKSNARANIGAGTSSFSGSYTDLTNKPTIPTVNNATLTIQKNGTNVQTFTANSSSDKTANITVPTKVSELTNDSGFITDAGVTGVKGNSETNYRTGNVNITKGNIGLGNVPNVSTNNQTPTFTQASTRANIASGETLTVILGKIMKFFADLKAVAFSGSYADLSNKPTIPTVNNATLTIQKNGTNVQTFTANQSTNATANITMSKSDVGLGNVGNFKAVSTVASQGLTNTEKSNARANIDAGTSSFSGSYTDLTNKPTIPTVNNATLTIQKNGTNVQTFTANSSSNKTANITVPTKVSELTNDSNYLKNGGKGNSATQLTLNQEYTFAEDGYCVLTSGASAGTTAIVALYGTDGVSLGSYFLCTPVNGYGSSIPFYVKKGFKVKPTRLDSGCGIYAVPIKY